MHIGIYLQERGYDDVVRGKAMVFMELLSPAGSFDTLKAAVQSGADAVYIGGSKFSARKGAVNFSMDEIKEAVKYCHLRGAAVHVAANILIKEKEKEEFLSYMGELSDAGVDAVIIQDIGMAQATHAMYPDLPLHASTQMTAASVVAVRFLENMGFSRVVLARELSQKAIADICANTNAEIEVFAHGAICMCYSGQCLMSSIIGGRSGNRGMCAQPCRLPYKIGGKTAYHLSPKDLCMINRLDELEKAGVTSLKIEGRLKRKEYVAAVCGIYRKYMDNGQTVSKEDIKELLDAFNRSGFTDAYFDDKADRHMMSLENPSNISENVFTEEVLKKCRPDANLRRSEVYISARLYKDEPFSVCIWDEKGHFAEAHSDKKAEKAQNRPMDAQRLSSQLMKLGDTPFFAENVETDIESDAVIAVSEINDTRRRAIRELERQILTSQNRRKLSYNLTGTEKSLPEKILITAYVSTYEQALACEKACIDIVYADTHLANRLNKEFSNIAAKLPPVMRADREYAIPETDTVLISNIGQINPEKKCIGDFRLNITNSESVRFFDNLERITLSPELNVKEAEKISAGCEVIAYGRIPLMVTENCPLKNCGMCQKFNMKHSISDRRNEVFPIKCAEGCVCEILNSKPIYMADKAEILKKMKVGAIRLIFTVENSRECGKIIEEYKMGLMGKTVKAPPENTFTRGHFFRGIE